MKKNNSLTKAKKIRAELGRRRHLLNEILAVKLVSAMDGGCCDNQLSKYLNKSDTWKYIGRREELKQTIEQFEKCGIF